jgi:hypothetical protein
MTTSGTREGIRADLRSLPGKSGLLHRSHFVSRRHCHPSCRGSSHEQFLREVVEVFVADESLKPAYLAFARDVARAERRAHQRKLQAASSWRKPVTVRGRGDRTRSNARNGSRICRRRQGRTCRGAVLIFSFSATVRSPAADGSRCPVAPAPWTGEWEAGGVAPPALCR